jgi:hypothetical protein
MSSRIEHKKTGDERGAAMANRDAKRQHQRIEGGKNSHKSIFDPTSVIARRDTPVAAMERWV